MKWFCILFALLLCCSVGCGDTDAKSKELRSKQASLAIFAHDLYREYEANEVAADLKYKGKVIVVEGFIENIGKDITDTAYVVLSGGEGEMLGVQCSFSPSMQRVVAMLQKGKAIKVKGEVQGKMMNVLVSNCVPPDDKDPSN